jgi:small conductance mechanosensitive channel
MEMQVPWDVVVRWTLAVAIVAVAVPASSLLVRLARRAARKTAGEAGDGVTTAKFLAEVGRVVVLAAAIMVALGLVGVDRTSIAAVLAAATLAIGLALQGTLANVAAGVLIVALRIYRVGDLIEVMDHTGHVRLVSLFTTELETFQGRQVLVPNGEVLKKPVVNISRHGQRRVDVSVTLDWDSDAAAAADCMVGAVAGLEGVLPTPAPRAMVSTLPAGGVTLVLHVWASREAAGTVGLILPGLVHAALRNGGFEPPRDQK